MFEQFTSEARDVVARSQDEARRLGLLTGSDLDGMALAALGSGLVKVREASEAHLDPAALGPKRQPMPKGHLPLSKQGKKVLEHAVHEATRVPPGQLSSGHLLLGLLREADPVNRHALMPRLLQKREQGLRLLRSEAEQLIPSRAA